MTREELEHIIRASGDITDQYEFVIVGSQSILGAVPRPEDVFTVSMEADIYPLRAPELADRIDGTIGEGSQFHETYGYYAQCLLLAVQFLFQLLAPAALCNQLTLPPSSLASNAAFQALSCSG